MRAIQAIRAACQFLSMNPFSCRKADTSPFVRELMVPFRATDHVLLFETRAARHVHLQTLTNGSYLELQR